MPELPPAPPSQADLIASLRAKVRAAQQDGYQMSEIDRALKQNYHLSLQQVMSTNRNDVGRMVTQGATLGHADELAGAVGKLRGQDYRTVRDAVRFEDQQFVNAGHGVENTLVQGAAGMVPGLALAPLTGGGSEVGVLGNMLRGAAGGAALGAVAGEGNSTADTPSGVLWDAGLGAFGGGVLGAVGGAVTHRVARGLLPKGPKGAVEQAASELMPQNPAVLEQMLARQEELAPGTTTLADLAPDDMRGFVNFIGADARTAIQMNFNHLDRIARLKVALRDVGTHYDALKGLVEPADPQIVAALDAVGRRDLVQRGQVDLADLHKLRSALIKLAVRSSDPAKAMEQRQAAGAITNWIADPQRAPWIKDVDVDYAILRDALGRAGKTEKALTESRRVYAATRGGGGSAEDPALGNVVPAVAGGARSVGVQLLRKLTPSERIARAKAAAELLLTPQRDATGIQRLITVRDALLQPRTAPVTNALALGTASGAVQGVAQGVSAP